MWSRLGSEVTVVEYLGAIGGPGMDSEVSKAIQRLLQKQGMKFKLNTKVMGGDVGSSSISVNIEGAKDGKTDSVCLKLGFIKSELSKLIYIWL